MEYAKETVVILKTVKTISWGGVIDGEDHHINIQDKSREVLVQEPVLSLGQEYARHMSGTARTPAWLEREQGRREVRRDGFRGNRVADQIVQILTHSVAVWSHCSLYQRNSMSWLCCCQDQPDYFVESERTANAEAVGQVGGHYSTIIQAKDDGGQDEGSSGGGETDTCWA